MYRRSGTHSVDSKSTKYETFVADSNVTGCDKCSCDGKVESKTTGDDEPNNTPPGIGSSFAMCPLSYLKKLTAFNSWKI